MRSYAFAIAVGALFAFPISAFSQVLRLDPEASECRAQTRADLSGKKAVRKCGKLV